MKKVSLVFALAILFTTWAPTSAQTGVNGTWQAESTPPGQPLTLVLREEGSKVTGAARGCGAPPIAISEGSIDRNTITFECNYADAGHTVVLTGILNGDVIEFSWELHVRDGGVPLAPSNRLFGPVAPPQFTAKRAPATVDNALEEIANHIREVSPVSFDRILQAAREPQNWLTYSGNVLGQRYSPLIQITPANVKSLELAWIWQAQSLAIFEATPLVVDGVLYTVQAPNDVVALDAVTGHVLWTSPYTPEPRARASGGDGRPNRGLAIHGDNLFIGTLDAHLLALDAHNGKMLWNTTVADALDPSCQGRLCYVITDAPLVVKDRVIVGVGGGDNGVGRGTRGFIAAFNVTTGKEVWRFSTIPAPGEPGNETWSGDSWKIGGGGVWNTGAYDPDLNLTYWGTGNPNPSGNSGLRLGDNLYTDSIVALDADTGKLKWHYQFTPHDDNDWDSAQVPVLADIQWQGRLRKVMLWANRNGLMYVLDRTTGEFLMGKPFVEVNWLSGFDDKGRPVGVPPKTGLKPGGAATNWYPPSYSRSTGLFYFPSWEESSKPRYSSVQAFDPKTGEKKWEFKVNDALFKTGVLTTASDIVFTGVGMDPISTPAAARLASGYFYALDARTGQLLWRESLAGPVTSGPVSFSVGDKQFIAVAAGNTLFAFALRQ